MVSQKFHFTIAVNEPDEDREIVLGLYWKKPIGSGSTDLVSEALALTQKELDTIPLTSLRGHVKTGKALQVPVEECSDLYGSPYEPIED